MKGTPIGTNILEKGLINLSRGHYFKGLGTKVLQEGRPNLSMGHYFKGLGLVKRDI